MDHVSRSRKRRALALALKLTLPEIAHRYRAMPLTYREIAKLWQQAVDAAPEMPRTFRFNTSDVYRVIKRYGRGLPGSDPQ